SARIVKVQSQAVRSQCQDTYDLSVSHSATNDSKYHRGPDSVRDEVSTVEIGSFGFSYRIAKFSCLLPAPGLAARAGTISSGERLSAIVVVGPLPPSRRLANDGR